jgi:hypothetical protein
MDIMTCLPKWERIDAIFVVVDMFSKLAKFAPTQINTTVVRMGKLFFDMWVRHNGMPKFIVCDWHVKFMSELWMILMKEINALPSSLIDSNVSLG